jgi:large subunit ribosomal protein L4
MPDNQNRHASAWTALGTARTESVQLPEATFDGVINMPVMHQAVKAFMANQRQGNASTKIRKYVVGGNQKPWKQKGTGRARQGSTRAPHFVGGGTVFGPTPRPYDEYVPRQVRALAKKSAFNARQNEGAIFVIDAFNYESPKTAALIGLIARLDVSDKKVLILTDGVKPNVFLSGRNIPNVHVMPYSDSSTYHILWSDVVLVEAGAVGATLAPIAEESAAPVAKKARPAADVATAAKHAPAKGSGKTAKKAAKKAAKTEARAAAKTSPARSAKKASAKSAPTKGSAKPAAKKKSNKKEK